MLELSLLPHNVHQWEYEPGLWGMETQVTDHLLLPPRVANSRKPESGAECLEPRHTAVGWGTPSSELYLITTPEGFVLENEFSLYISRTWEAQEPRAGGSLESSKGSLPCDDSGGHHVVTAQACLQPALTTQPLFQQLSKGRRNYAYVS